MNSRGPKWNMWLRILITAAASVSCAQGPMPKDHYYRLEIAVPQPGPRIIDGSVEVHRFSADDLTAGRAIVYSKAGQPNQLMTYHYHFWVESPTTALQHELVRYLREAHAARAVTTPALRTQTDYVLRGRIQRLEQVTGQKPRAAMALELILKKTESKEPALVRVYQLEIPLQGSSISSGVNAINQGLTEIYASFLADLSKEFPINSSLRGTAAATRGRSLVAGAAASAPKGMASFAPLPRARRPAKRRSREPGRSDEAISNYEVP